MTEEIGTKDEDNHEEKIDTYDVTFITPWLKR